MKFWLEDNDTEIYFKHNAEKSLAAGRFIRTSKNKCYKCRMSVSNSVYVNKLANILN